MDIDGIKINEVVLEGFKIKFGRDKNNKYMFKIKSTNKGGHYAKHDTFDIVNSNGEIVRNELIDETNVDLLISNIKRKGVTEGFNILECFESDISEIDVATINHHKTESEETYTATGDKLMYHWPIIKKYQETGYGSIVRATVTLHQLCSSHCQYCSTIARNKRDSISLNEAKEFIRKLYYDQADLNKHKFKKYNDLYNIECGSDIRLRGLILSGGGQPNLWPYFVEFVEWLSNLDIDLGLITNGFPKNIPEDVYNNFKWIRLSITPEDASPHYKNRKFNNQYIPFSVINNKNITFGLSYVYGGWTTDDIICRLNASIDDWGLDYVRLLTDCNLTRNSQLAAHKRLSDKMYNLGLIDQNGKPNSKIFHQLKYHGTKEEGDQIWIDGQCYLQVYNTFWDSTGHDENGESYCYPCDSITVLSDEINDKVIDSERRFNSDRWGTVTNNNVQYLFEKKVTKYFDPRKECQSCLFMNNNNKVKEISELDIQEIKNLTSKATLKHINFP